MAKRIVTVKLTLQEANQLFLRAHEGLEDMGARADEPHDEMDDHEASHAAVEKLGAAISAVESDNAKFER